MSEPLENCIQQVSERRKRGVHTFLQFIIRNSSFVILLVPALSFAQNRTIDWKLLSKVEWSEKYSKEHDETFYYPKFAPEVLNLNGQLIEIEGFVIPVDVETGYFVLSANPFASCFFCGQAGPETILELQLKAGGKRFKTDEVVTFRGRLKLNYEDLMHCNYILELAQPVK